MNILVLDRDDVATGMIEGFCREKDHSITIEKDRNKVYDLEGLNDIEVFFMDLSTLTNPLRFIVELKARLNSLPYIVFMSREGDEKRALKAGANDFLAKPFETQKLQKYLDNAKLFKDLVKELGDSQKQFPYHKGIISNSALNELFLSSLERTSRYIEASALLFFFLKNSEQIQQDFGDDIREQATQWMANHVIRLRRQSDIMAQIDDSKFVILIPRPEYSREPFDAAQRFRASFMQHPGTDIPEHAGKKIDLRVNVSVIEIPGSKKVFDETIICPP